jgi:hypothetical protein
MNKEAALRILLVLVAIAHLGLGLSANLAPPELLGRIASASYGALIEVTPQSHHLVRMVGAFMIGVGLMALMASSDPRRHRAIIVGIAVILGLRVLQRLVFFGEVVEAFDMSPVRIWSQAAFFLAVAGALLASLPKRQT